MTIDTFNKFFVGVHQGSVVVGRSPARLSPRDALLLAAYLVAMAEIVGKPEEDGSFSDWLEAVRNT